MEYIRLLKLRFFTILFSCIFLYSAKVQSENFSYKALLQNREELRKELKRIKKRKKANAEATKKEIVILQKELNNLYLKLETAKHSKEKNINTLSLQARQLSEALSQDLLKYKRLLWVQKQNKEASAQILLSIKQQKQKIKKKEKRRKMEKIREKIRKKRRRKKEREKNKKRLSNKISLKGRTVLGKQAS